MDPQITIVGANASPYSRKMRALLRYRRIAFRWVVRGSVADHDIPEVPVGLIPVLVFPGGDATIDSTPQIKRLEREFEGRSVFSPDPVVDFFDALIEDYADEWLTKAMYHYRWAFEADAHKASHLLPLDGQPHLDAGQLEKMATMFADRQIGRLGVVGSNAETGPIIEASYRRLLEVLDAHLLEHDFIMGSRPGAGDFGVYGQLTQLALFDPTSAQLAVQIAPRVVAWVTRFEDLSSIDVEDDHWINRESAATALRPLLSEIGRVYAPFLLANADALAADDDKVCVTIDGARWTQKPFRYQGHCLRHIRERHASLSESDRSFVSRALAGTGCEPLLDLSKS